LRGPAKYGNMLDIQHIAHSIRSMFSHFRQASNRHLEPRAPSLPGLASDAATATNCDAATLNVLQVCSPVRNCRNFNLNTDFSVHDAWSGSSSHSTVCFGGPALSLMKRQRSNHFGFLQRDSPRATTHHRNAKSLAQCSMPCRFPPAVSVPSLSTSSFLCF
jgi:hypothetical protein